ncbi:protein trichome birefringence-like 2 [Hibiscus syriacus]|uniref:protein trichome birefringence-like 2 n=1 Tax=Hibiscus syriacus TaxID=106335 RepID=UPI001923D2FE|nr:protein trichome birefringence-like 2 [Hibiscus syriacus]
MDVKKHGLSDQLSPRGKAGSRLVWGSVASLIVLTGLLLNSSLKGSVLSYSVTTGAAAVSLRSSVANVTKEPRPRPVDTEKRLDNASEVAEKQDVLEEIEGDWVDLEDGVDINMDGNFVVEDANGLVFQENSNLLGSNGDETVKNVTLVGENVNATNVTEGEFVGNVIADNNHQGEIPVLPVEDKAMELDGSFETCDLFDGRWVWNGRSKPYYRPGSCPYIDKDFDCQRNGRPDNGYIKWKWQPNRCELPRLNATDFLERLRGKRLVYIGDSLNRNMWESMVCILRRSVKKKKRVYEISGRSDFKKKGIYAFRFEDYNCSVDFVAAPFLVKESSFKRKNGSIETLRLDLMDPATSMYHDADLMVFNTGHWWTHEKTSKGEDYYQEGDYVYPRLKVLKAYQKALATWSRWVDKNVDISRTQVFFRGYSVTHFWGGQWNSGGQCHQETEPITNETHLTKYPSKMRAVEHVLQTTKIPVIYLNISRLTDYRKDAHPSIYRREYKTEEERNRAVGAQDCSHWCLPGVPDTWNELLYASLLKAGKGIWKR